MNIVRNTIVASSLAAVALGPLATAQANAAPAPITLDAGAVPAADLLDRCCGYLGWNVILGGTDVEQALAAAEVQLHQAVKLDRAGCEDVLTSLLSTRGLVIVPLDEDRNLYELLWNQGPRRGEILQRAPHRTPQEVLSRPALFMPVTVVVPLEHINATIATNALRPFFAANGQSPGNSITLGNVGNNSSLLVTGLQAQVASVVRMLRVCDVPGNKQEQDRLSDLEARIAKLEAQLAPPRTGK